MVAMNGGNAAEAVKFLQEALELYRAWATATARPTCCAIWASHWSASATARPPAKPWNPRLVLAQDAHNVYAEKLVLDRLAMTLTSLHEPAAALPLLSQALEMARGVGDHQQEPRLLWMQAIALAELNRTDQAIAKAEASIAFLRAEEKPEAAWYEAQLERFRSNASALSSPSPVDMGGPIYAGAVTTTTATATPHAAGQPRTGPGLLRMALSATKAMATFIGSGMKPSSVDVQNARLAVCRTCEHHTGLRCRICGCFTNVKVKMTHERCPIGKWPA